LSPGVKYYVTAYAINPAGTSYGDETFFTTQINLPVVTTSAVSELTSTTARVGGLVNDDSGFGITQRGIYWGTDPEPRLTGTRLELGSGDGEFSTTLSGLSREFTYYVQAFATNIKGTSYGGEISFVTEPGLATIVTSMPYDVTPFSATVGGNISSDGGIGVTERGVFWGRSPDPVTTGIKLQMGTGTGSFETVIDTLSPAVTYYLQAYAVNLVGTSRGEEKQFTTKGSLPVISKTFITDLTQTSAVLNITLGKGDLPSLLSVDYGITVAYGSSATPLNIPEIKADTTIKITIDGLQSLTYYHYRAIVSNDLGTIYSSDAEFRTVITGKEGTVTDVEGNLYNTIGIGYQEWMTRNLKSVLYNDGAPIPLVRKDSVWEITLTPAYSWYLNDSISNQDTYGALYNWYAVQSGKLCPSGWRVPTIEDVQELVSYAGGAGIAGKVLKEPGTVYWKSPNSDSTDVYGFSARGGGKRSEKGIHDFQRVEGTWWISEEYSIANASYFNILFNYSNLFVAYYNKKTGMSVRCVRD